MKEYIIVILSGICKAVEKTKWPEEPIYCNSYNQGIVKCEKDLHVCQCMITSLDVVRQKLKAFKGGALVEEIPRGLVRQHHIPSTKGFKYKDGAYPIDPAKWELVEQWQFKTPYDDEWFECSYAQAQQVKSLKEIGHETRLTATIKPKEHSTGPIIPEGVHVAVMEPTRKLVTEELIEWLEKWQRKELPEQFCDVGHAIRKVQSLKPIEIENIKHAMSYSFFNPDDKFNKEWTDTVFTQTYQPK